MAVVLSMDVNFYFTVTRLAKIANANNLSVYGVMVSRLADILFIQCVRAHIASSSETCKSGWLRAIFDPRIGVVLKAMHERVGNLWALETLAAAAGMSRSAFALRFKELLGETPLEYLTNWRMYKATELQQKDGRKLFDVAKSVGYDSDA
jgi:transcriptional regulator GlxA family with amidase domain